MIRVGKVDGSNWEACAQLKVSAEQERHIASNLYSIAEVQFLPGFEVRALYHGDTLVGFAMYGLDPDDRNYWIYRFMIDERYQSRGYGKQAMAQIIQEIERKPDRTDVLKLGYHPDNETARRFYASVGFVETGPSSWGEVLAEYRFN
ncbi:spermidine acetyltransferase [Paenibacillus sp. 598K]|uniref:GNAT family N-acetyltransferase n=1 Tax=Paenibacillus sp. 598K TaxID=1117987 RepID=UPI000FF9944F|nr:GNAT family N-acetyltransferase [Paenibacillus sp. 598K]GBF76146.1 spermidine acetyltransferase [Paenibacillus sp. 598K]